MAFSSVSLDQQFYVAFTYALGLWAVAFAGMWLGRPRVSLAAEAADRVQAGETLAVGVSVQAIGRRGIGLNVLPDRLPPDVDAATRRRRGAAAAGSRAKRRGSRWNSGAKSAAFFACAAFGWKRRSRWD